MEKVTINLKNGIATVTEGEDTFIGKLIEAGNKIKINTTRAKGEFRLAKKVKEGK